MMFRRNKGSQTIEFALIILPLMILVLVGFELVRLMWVTMVFESAVSSAIRDARTMIPSPTVAEKMREHIAQFPLLSLDNIQVDAPSYADSVASLASGQLVSSPQAMLAQYRINYQFQFLLAPKFSESLPSVTNLNRTVLVSYDA